MSDTETETDSQEVDIENELENLEDRLDRIENNSSMNRISVQSHNIRVELNSEDCSLEKMVKMASSEMREREKMAMVGEYQVIEEEEMFEFIL